ncbi:MAG: methane monooxygenase/ammonia monooxygenase subunit A [Burkholderiales bacterium]
MTANDRAVVDSAGLSPQVAKWSRLFDWMVVVVAAFLIISVTQIHFILLAGDWDFFIDWKDRQYWVLVTPVVTMMMAVAFQAIFWNLFRLPIGATASVGLLLIGTWIVRFHGWEALAYFPLALVIPSTCLLSAIALDAILSMTRSWVLTGVFGGLLYALLFFPSNWIYLAPYFLPVEHMGQMVSLADLIGYTYPRSATPEYIRMIERGTLRTFEDSAVWVSTAFSGFICIFAYAIFWWVGTKLSTPTYIPTGKRFRAAMGLGYASKGAQ